MKIDGVRALQVSIGGELTINQLIQPDQAKQ